jgi:hypothetical protein
MVAVCLLSRHWQLLGVNMADQHDHNSLFHGLNAGQNTSAIWSSSPHKFNGHVSIFFWCPCRWTKRHDATTPTY